MKLYEYYPSLCGHCHQGPRSPSSPLLRCSRCKIFYYCSKDCQAKDWKRGHKRFCSLIASSSEGRSHFFSGHSGQAALQWMNDCCTNIEQFSEFRQWRSVFFFPPVCRKVGCFSPGEGGQEGGQGDGLLTCERCLSVSWCSEKHKDEGAAQHQQFCSELKLARFANSLKNKDIETNVTLDDDLDVKFKGPAEDIARQIGLNYQYLKRTSKSENDLNKSLLEAKFLSDFLSGPLTLLHIGSKFLPDFSRRKSLEIHIVGASDYEADGCDVKWEHLAHRLPALRSLLFKFIGPDLKSPNSNNNTERRVTCDPCSSLGRVISHGYYRMTYQEFREKDSSEPDLVLVQNCGFHARADLRSERVWKEGQLGSLLHQTGSTLVFTSYTEAEARRDMERMVEECGQEMEVVVNCQENPMRSLYPRRSFESWYDGVDVLYSNYYLSVVKPKTVKVPVMSCNGG